VKYAALGLHSLDGGYCYYLNLNWPTCLYLDLLTEVQVQVYVDVKREPNIAVKTTNFRFVMGDLVKPMHVNTFSSLLMVLIFATAKESTIEI
jgi:hypothetical protein